MISKAKCIEVRKTGNAILCAKQVIDARQNNGYYASVPYIEAIISCLFGRKHKDFAMLAYNYSKSMKLSHTAKDYGIR